MQEVSARTLFGNLWPAAPAGVNITSVVTDSRAAGPGSVFVAIKGERVDGHDYAASAYRAGAAYILAQHPVSGVPQDRVVLVPDVLDAMIQMGANYRTGFSPLVLGITGSVGKTTTKEFCSAVFFAFGETLKTEGNQNNEIGMPNTLFRLNDATRYAVVEMGMQGLGEISKLALAARPDGAIITKIGKTHIELLGSVENILKAKLEICDGLPLGAPLVLNGDDKMLYSAKLPESVHAVFAALDNEEAEVRAGDIHREGDGQAFRILDAQFGRHDAFIPALGRHNVENALLAYTAATRLGLSAEQSAAALRRYEPAGMRQRVREWRGATLIEDCYNANPDSMRAALAVLAEMAGKGRAIAVLGDMRELGDASEREHRALGPVCAEKGVELLVTVGPEAAYIAREAAANGVPAEVFQTNGEAASFVKQQIQPGDTVLVKASRGLHFEEILEELQ